jgi:hypothetical protein
MKCPRCGGDFENVKTFTVVDGDEEFHTKCFEGELKEYGY